MASTGVLRQVFFCKYNDPIYVKMEKLEIMIKLASDKNIDQVLLEFKEYATEVDVDFVRKVGPKHSQTPTMHISRLCMAQMQSEPSSPLPLQPGSLPLWLGYTSSPAILVLQHSCCCLCKSLLQTESSTSLCWVF